MALKDQVFRFQMLKLQRPSPDAQVELELQVDT